MNTDEHGWFVQWSQASAIETTIRTIENHPCSSVFICGSSPEWTS
jgi:hypothetical protein